MEKETKTRTKVTEKGKRGKGTQLKRFLEEALAAHQKHAQPQQAIRRTIEGVL